jgi:hypothetical protein
MVKTLLAGLLVCGAAFAHAEGGCIEATETDPRLCPAELAAVRQVRVQHQGRPGNGAPEPLVDCRRFVLTPAMVRRYFARAMRVEDNRGEHAVDRGPCEAEGTLRFADGTRAWWRIEQAGTATLLMDGSSESMTLYCNRCRFKPFAF